MSLRNEENEWLSINLKTAAVAPSPNGGRGEEGWAEHSSDDNSHPLQHSNDQHTAGQVDIRNCTYLGAHTFTINIGDQQQTMCSEATHDCDHSESFDTTVTGAQHFTAVYLGMHSFSTPAEELEELPTQRQPATDSHVKDSSKKSDSLEFCSFDAVYLGMT